MSTLAAEWGQISPSPGDTKGSLGTGVTWQQCEGGPLPADMEPHVRRDPVEEDGQSRAHPPSVPLIWTLRMSAGP